MKYQLKTLGKFCDESKSLIQTGPFGSQLHQEDYTDEGRPVVMPKDIIDGRVDEKTVARVSEVMAKKLERHKLKYGAIVMPRRGDIGKRAYIKKDQEGFLCGTGCIKIELKETNLLARFLYYYLEQNQVKDWIEKRAIGSTMLNLNTSIIRSIEIPEIPISEQKRIADILSSYDDLIENNRRRIKLLEESARLLYQEWFVRLRFPEHEQVPVVAGVPQGWERKPIAEVCESVDYGYTASSSNEEIGPRFLRITDIASDTLDWLSVPFCEIPENKINKFLLQEGDIVVARTGATVGYAKRIGSRNPKAVFASYLVRLRLSTKLDNLIAGILVESDVYKAFIQGRINGAAQPNANAKVLSSIEVFIPPQPLQAQFHELVIPIFEQKEILDLQNQRLQQARDLLLPRLMRGELLP